MSPCACQVGRSLSVDRGCVEREGCQVVELLGLGLRGATWLWLMALCAELDHGVKGRWRNWTVQPRVFAAVGCGAMGLGLWGTRQVEL